MRWLVAIGAVSITLAGCGSSTHHAPRSYSVCCDLLSGERYETNESPEEQQDASEWWHALDRTGRSPATTLKEAEER